MKEEREMNFFDLCRVCFNGIGRGITACIQFAGTLIRLTYRQWWVVLIVLVLVLTCVNIYTRKDNRIYKIDAVAILNGPTTELTQEKIKRLSFPVNPKINAQQNLVELLGLPWEDVEHISHLQTFHVIDCLHDSVADYIDYDRKSSPLDTVCVQMPNRLCIQYRTTTPQNAALIEEALLNYLNSDEAMQAAFQTKKLILGREVEFAKKQVEKLDSLTSAFYFEQGTGMQAQGARSKEGIVLGRREIKLFPGEIHGEFRRYQKLAYLQAFCTAPVVLEDHFAVHPAPVNGRTKWNVIGLVIGWLLGCLIAALVENRKAILSWLKK